MLIIYNLQPGLSTQNAHNLQPLAWPRPRMLIIYSLQPGLVYPPTRKVQKGLETYLLRLVFPVLQGSPPKRDFDIFSYHNLQPPSRPRPSMLIIYSFQLGLDPGWSYFTASSLGSAQDAHNLRSPALTRPKMLIIFGFQRGFDPECSCMP